MLLRNVAVWNAALRPCLQWAAARRPAIFRCLIGMCRLAAISLKESRALIVNCS